MASVKKQILDAIRDRVATLDKAVGGGFRMVKQTRNLALLESTLPALTWAKSKEVEIVSAQDTRGRRYQFSLGFKIVSENIEDEEELTASVEAVMESDIQLGGLCITIDGREEAPFIDAATGESGGVFLTYDVQYRHLRGEPSARY